MRCCAGPGETAGDARSPLPVAGMRNAPEFVEVDSTRLEEVLRRVEQSLDEEDSALVRAVFQSYAYVADLGLLLRVRGTLNDAVTILRQVLAANHFVTDLNEVLASCEALRTRFVRVAKTGLMLLRNDILGPDRFDPAFRKFIRDWAYKHPQPSDFFRAMDSASGEDLSWFWRGWFFTNGALDLDIDGVTYVDNDPAKGAQIAVSNRGQLVLPATMRVTFKDGTTSDIAIPAETWIQSGSHTFTMGSRQPIASVIIDPDRQLPERDRSRATWSAP